MLRLRQLLAFLRLLLSSRADIVLENIALRHQICVLSRQKKRPRLNHLDRMFCVWLRRFWPKWRESLIIVKPDTVVCWHRDGFRRYWRWKWRSGKKQGRPGTKREVRELIWRMWRENLWGAPRIHGELLMLGIVVSERTVSRYLQRRNSSGEKAQAWSAFLRNHREAIAAMDFFLVPTFRFRLLYGLYVISHGRREIVHANVTEHPTSGWVVQQIREAFPGETTCRYLIHDRDTIFGKHVDETIISFGMKPVRTSYRSPWQNGVTEPWVGSCRREMLDHAIILSEKHLRRLVREYVDYHNDDRCHYSLDKDAPAGRLLQH